MLDSPENCVVCFKELISPQENGLISLDSELRIYFLLRKIFRLGEQKLLSFFLRDSGNPSEWVGLCGDCKGLVEDGRCLFREIAALEAQLGRTKSRLRAKVRASWKEGEEDGCGSLTEVVRKAVIVQDEGEGIEEDVLSGSVAKEEGLEEIFPVKVEPSSPSLADWIEEDEEESLGFGFEIDPEEQKDTDDRSDTGYQEELLGDDFGMSRSARGSMTRKVKSRKVSWSVPEKEEGAEDETEEDEVGKPDERRSSAMDFCTLLREANKSLFKCSECGKTFNLINTFRVHLNRSHGIFFKPIRIRNKKLSKNKKRQFMKPRRAQQSALDPCKEEPRSPSPNPALCFEKKKESVDLGLEGDPEEEDVVDDDDEDYQEIIPDDEIDKVGVSRRRSTRVKGTNSSKAGDSVSEEDGDDDELSLSEYSETEENAESSKSEDDSDDHESEGKSVGRSVMDYCTLLKEEDERLFKCNECEKSFNLRNSFRVHLNRIHGIYFNYSKTTKLKDKKKHFIKPKSALDYCTFAKNGDEDIYTCNECKKEFQLIPSFRVHLNKKHGIYIQPERKKARTSVMEPQELHSSLEYIEFLKEQNVFKCMKCGKVLEKRATMRCHLNKAHGIFFKPSKVAEMEMIPKPDLKKIAHTPLNYCEQVKKKVDGDQIELLYKCTKCQKECNSRVNFVKHLNHQHNIYFLGKRKGQGFKGMHANVDEESHCLHKDECPEKGRTFHSSYALENHNRLFHRYLEIFYKNNKKAWFEYVQLAGKVGPLRPWRCLKGCKTWFTSEEDRRKHQAEQHPLPDKEEESEGPSYTCKSCYASYSSKWELVIHLEQLHEGDGLQEVVGKTKDLSQCTECPAKFSRPQGQEFHMAMVHQKSGNNKRETVVAICHICGYGMKSITMVTKHMRYHMGERPFVCEVCGETFTEERYLNSHLAVQHAEQTESASSSTADRNKIKKNHTCSTCKKTFSTSAYLQVHIKTQHERQFRYRCPVCNVGMQFQSFLKQHMLIHSEERQYKCPYTDCDAKFRSVSGQNGHVRTKHLLDLPFPCKECGKMFAFSKDRKRHYDAVHKKEVLFTCHLCGKGFPILDYYRGHMKRIHGCYEPTNTPANAD